jgi:hypothetical protein
MLLSSSKQLLLESTTCPEKIGEIHVMPDSWPQATEIRSGADAPQTTPNALASAQDLPIPERLPAVTAAATRGLGEPASGFNHGPSSSSPSQAPQEVRERASQASALICTVLCA